MPSRAAEEPDQTSSRSSESAPVAATLARLWERFRDANLDRVSALEATAAALLRGEALDEQRRRAMERAAHGLAGSVGTYGFHEGSRLAREIEQLLGNGGALDRQARQLADLTADLRRELEATCRFS